MKPFFVVKSNGEFFDLKKNPHSIINIKSTNLFILNDLNLKTELNKMFNLFDFISNNKNLLTVLTYVEQLFIDIEEQKIQYSNFYLDIIKFLSQCEILENSKLSKEINSFFETTLNIENPIEFLIQHSKVIQFFFEYLQILLNKSYIHTISNIKLSTYENSIYFSLINKNLKNFKNIFNLSLFANWESELDEEAKINYPEYYLKPSQLNSLKIQSEHIRYSLLNSYLINYHNISLFNYNSSFNNYYNRSFEFWNLNCYYSFNIIFNFLKKFNPQQIDKPLVINANDLKTFLTEQNYLTITSIFLIDILVNWHSHLKFRKDYFIETKLEGINGSGSGFIKSSDKSKERKYKNTFFDLVDIIMSLIVYNDPQNNLESIYLTGDKGINLFFNWYSFKNINGNINIQYKDHTYFNINVLNLISQEKFLENNIKNTHSIADKFDFLNSIRKKSCFFDKLELIIKEFSFFDKLIFEKFLQENKTKLKKFYIYNGKSRFTFNYMLNNPFDYYGWSKDMSKNLIDLYFVEVSNMYFKYFLEYKINETIKNMKDYFT